MSFPMSIRMQFVPYVVDEKDITNSTPFLPDVVNPCWWTVRSEKADLKDGSEITVDELGALPGEALVRSIVRHFDF